MVVVGSDDADWVVLPQVANNKNMYSENKNKFSSLKKVGEAYLFLLVCIYVGAFFSHAFYDSCTFWTVYARVLQFHILIPYWKIAHPYFISELCPFLELCPFWNEMEILFTRYLKMFKLWTWYWYTD